MYTSQKCKRVLGYHSVVLLCADTQIFIPPPWPRDFYPRTCGSILPNLIWHAPFYSPLSVTVLHFSPTNGCSLCPSWLEYSGPLGLAELPVNSPLSGPSFFQFHLICCLDLPSEVELDSVFPPAGSIYLLGWEDTSTRGPIPHGA